LEIKLNPIQTGLGDCKHILGDGDAEALSVVDAARIHHLKFEHRVVRLHVHAMSVRLVSIAIRDRKLDGDDRFFSRLVLGGIADKLVDERDLDTRLHSKSVVGLLANGTAVGVKELLVVEARHGDIDAIDMFDALDTNAIACKALLARFDHKTNNCQGKRLQVSFRRVVLHVAVLVFIKDVA